MSVYVCALRSLFVSFCVCVCGRVGVCLCPCRYTYLYCMSVYVFVCLYCMNMCLCVSVCVCACNVHHVAHCVRGSPLCYDSPWGEHDLCLRLFQHFAKQEDCLSGNMKTNILPKKILNISERWKQLTKEARAKSSFKWLQLKGL